MASPVTAGGAVPDTEALKYPEMIEAAKSGAMTVGESNHHDLTFATTGMDCG